VVAAARRRQAAEPSALAEVDFAGVDEPEPEELDEPEPEEHDELEEAEEDDESLELAAGTEEDEPLRESVR
jgi:hypothetical protein